MRNTKLFKFIMMCVLVCSATAASASVAQAWTTNGTLPFTATAGGALLRVNSPTPAGVICQGPNTARGTLQQSALVNPAVVGLSFTWNNCTVAGFSATVSCNTTGTLVALSYTAGAPPYGSPPGVTTGEVRGVTCTITVPSAPCTITVTSTGAAGRAVTGTYTNPTTTSAGRVTVLTTPAQTLTASWTGAGCAGIFGSASGSASAQINSTTGAALVYTVTNPSVFTQQPWITNP